MNYGYWQYYHSINSLVGRQRASRLTVKVPDRLLLQHQQTAIHLVVAQ